MRSSVARNLARWAAASLLLAATVALYALWIHVNPTTVALTLLLLIQWFAGRWGLRLAAAASVAAALCFNYFFLPPVGTFSIGDAQNWVALAAFLAAALIGTNLADRLQVARAASERRGRELELLYDFGQRLLTPGGTAELLRELPFWIARGFGCSETAVYLADGHRLHASTLNLNVPVAVMIAASTASRPLAGPVPGSLLVPLAVGVRPVGAIYLACPVGSSDESGLPSLETLEAMSSLVALSLERATALEKLVHAEASAESDRLRATLLDAITHDLRTPLTSIKAATTALLSQAALGPDQRQELLTVIDEESDRLNGLIAQAVEMAAWDAHAVRLARRPTDLGSLIEEVLEDAPLRWPDRAVRILVPHGLPAVSIDPPLIAKVLLHLVENAAKYASPGTPIGVRAVPQGRWHLVTVADTGPGISEIEQERIFDKFYRSPAHRYKAPGSGMGLSISRAIVEAHGGRLTVESSAAGGSTFAFTVPCA